MKRTLQLLLAGVTAVSVPAAGAADFPDKPVRIIVPFSAGAAADAVARPLAAKLTEYWGRQVLVDNRAGLTIGAQTAATSPPDGYTLLLGATSTMVTTPLTVRKLPYDVERDFVPITRVVTLSPILTVNASLGVRSLKDLIALAKARPGQLNYASSGLGAPNHLGMEQLMSMTGISMTHVPYKGAAPAVVDLISNQVQVGFNTIPSVLQHIKSGKLTAIAVGSTKRSQVVPAVPAIAETVAGFDYGAWYGLFAPAKTPPAILEKIRADVRRVLVTPEFNQLLLSEGSEPAPSSGEELAQLMKHETALWSKVIKDRKINVE
ncbi:Bug family tripartite tricarboxylate transporter substrate binding protein [Ideonella sp. BN130291]|uniref:Bug family tripartite tricarboxylate transporter substrate binding protein n=1 Tax=Ideonella sp. BN130291 TaxID=3112940 RepID=UPI002E26696C|nr:tripartite tricarboxylate transporter substrate binding protein [Ideonella sp. BN130291]